MTPFVIGHRGAAGLAPENTLASIRRAHAEGVRWIEFDVMLSQDSFPMIFHDDTLKRTTNGRGAVARLDHDALIALDAGSWFAAEYKGEGIPTLQSVIDEISSLNLGANVEIKPSPGQGVETAKVTCQMILDKWPETLPAPIISSFDVSAMEVARDMLPDFERAMLFGRLAKNWQAIVEGLDCRALHISNRIATKKVVEKISSHGYPVRVYTINDPARAEELRRMGVSSVFTDRPDLIKD